MSLISRLALVFAWVMFGATACASNGDEKSIDIGPNNEITGILKVDQGICDASGQVSGSWFEMVEPGGSVGAGPYVTNFDSSCPDQTITPLYPGAVGLVFGSYQSHPNPAFDAATNGLAGEIVGPSRFYSVNFALGTERVSPVKGLGEGELSPPRIFVASDAEKTSDNELLIVGNFESMFVAWNGEFFEQGAPHPEGNVGATEEPRGSINLKSGKLSIRWISQVDSGPFAGFIGVWNLEGVLIQNYRCSTLGMYVTCKR